MITIVDVTGVFKFGFGNSPAIVGTMTRATSTVIPAKAVSIGIQQIYKYAGLVTPVTSSALTKFSQQLRFEHSFVKRPVIVTRGIARPVNFTTLKPAQLFANDAVRKIYKYSGINIPKVSSTFTKYLITTRFEGTGLRTAKVFSVSNLKNIYQFAGLNTPRIWSNINNNKIRFDFAGMNTAAKIFSIRYTSFNVPLSAIGFSFVQAAKATTIVFQRDSNLFKISSILRTALLTIKGYRDVFTGVTSIAGATAYSFTDSKFTTIFNLGSGLSSSKITTVLAKDLISDYNTIGFSGMRLAKILSAPPASWQQNTGTGTYTETLIQFWS